ncbi:hypothetical protein ACQKK5_26035 [Brevibacillus panacihumi]|uniref:hypothetical protein n=1 Tax=Brevibacillus panacihumi TaxID=497735 RepID=UPI003D03004A
MDEWNLVSLLGLGQTVQHIVLVFPIRSRHREAAECDGFPVAQVIVFIGLRIACIRAGHLCDSVDFIVPEAPGSFWATAFYHIAVAIVLIAF